ncbi:GNAT family N-acetyltransferase [Perlabentimonas gracilis]|uniref:GNAT family N-acetyltransferase n=1 Tax=Perlabentimonas gracilis TaxID=2715279 RepID=UPI0014076124|nr:GNAT family N-acetyltransferase [Perlabentimonas gracilis]NHB67173.1 GNAT family N-acetyltransferase [Perlabentimonas gracilis]
MALTFQQVVSVHDLEQIRELYVNSFPAYERREFNELVTQLSKPNFKIFRVLNINVNVGFISIWNFIDFTFVEHFAVSPEHRGRGVGKEVMTTLVRNEEKPIVLEVEPPIDDLSIRRVKFYKELGFAILPQVYMQPSYDGVKPQVELRLMTTHPAIAKERVAQWVKTIASNVYCL